MYKVSKINISQPFNPHIMPGSRVLVRHGKYKEETGKWEALENGELEVIVAWAMPDDEEEYKNKTGGESLIVDWAKMNDLHFAYHTIDIYPVRPKMPPGKDCSKSRDCVRLFPLVLGASTIDHGVDVDRFSVSDRFPLSESKDPENGNKFQVYEISESGFYSVSSYGDNPPTSRMGAEGRMHKWINSLPSRYEPDESIEEYEEPDVKCAPSFWELNGYYEGTQK